MTAPNSKKKKKSLFLTGGSSVEKVASKENEASFTEV